MGAPTDNNIHRVTGRLYVNPVNTNDPGNDFGGVAIGAVDRISFDPGFESRAFPAGEYGGQSFDILRFFGDCLLSLRIRGWDPDSLAVFLPGVGSVSGQPNISPTARSGRRVSPVRALFVPGRVTEQPALYLPNAIPLVEATAQMALEMFTELNLGVFFQGLRDSNGRTYQMAPLASIVL